MIELYMPPKPAIIQPAEPRLIRANFLPGMFPGAVAAAAAVQAFPTVETTNSGSTSGFTTSATFAVPLPASISAGDRLFIHIGLASSAGARTLTTPSGWTELYNVVGGGDLRRFVGYYKTASGSEGGTVTITASAASIWATNSYRISGHGAGIEAATPATASSSAPNPPNLSPSWGSAKTLWIATCGDVAGTAGSATEPSGYGSLISVYHDIVGNNACRAASARLESEAASEDPGAFTIPSSGNNAATVIGIQPA